MLRRIAHRLTRSFSSATQKSTSLGPLSKDDIRYILNISEEPAPLASVSDSATPASIMDVRPSLLSDVLAWHERGESIEAINAKFGLNLKGFRYGLPIPNINPEFKSLDAMIKEVEPEVPTPLENLFEALSLDKHSTFDDYQNSLQQTFAFSQLLGDQEPLLPEIAASYRALSFPAANLSNAKYMTKVRNSREINFNMPGAIELEDVNRFIPDLRPVSDFPHTPLVPIDARSTQLFEDAKRRRKERLMYFSLSKEQVGTAVVVAAALATVVALFTILVKQDEQMIIKYQRKKLARLESSKIRQNVS